MARILGIDIGHDAVRGVLIRTALRSVELARYLEVPVRGAPPSDAPPPPPIRVEGVDDARAFLDHEAEGEESEAEGEATAPALRTTLDPVAGAVRELIAACGSPPDAVIAAIPGGDASLRVVTLPAGVAKRVGEVLPFELESVLPFGVEDTVTDYQPLTEDETEIQVLAAAVHRDKVAEHLDRLQSLGLDPKELAVGAAALDGLVPLVPTLGSERPVALVDVGPDTTDVCFLVGGRCHLARTITGGVDLLRSDRREQLALRLRQTLAAFRAQDERPPSVLFLSGDGASVPLAADWLEEAMEIETRLVPLPTAPGTLDETRPRFARALALAGRAASPGRRIDLRKGEFAYRRSTGQLRRHAKLIGGCAALILVSIVFSISARLHVLSDEGERLEEALLAATEEAFGEGVRSPGRARELLEGGVTSDDPMPRFDAYDVLDAISGAIPDEIRHDTRRLEIEIDDEEREGKFEIQGRVASLAERDEIVAQLEAHECFGDIDKGRTSPGPNNQGLNYQLEVDVRCPGAGPAADEGDSPRGRRRAGR